MALREKAFMSTRIDVWQVSLCQPMADSATHPLSSDEFLQATKFQSALHRRSYLAAHVALRAILAKCTQVPAADLEFSRSETGKPMLLNVSHISFNLSHSHQYALVAVAPGAVEVGIDIERVAARSGTDAWARVMLGQRAYSRLTEVPDTRRLAYLYQMWVRKEAVAKAIGLGLSVSLERLPVERAGKYTSRPEFILRFRGSDWYSRDVVCPVGYVAALGTNARHYSLRIRSWRPDPDTLAVSPSTGERRN
jgi:4'-phosphopantetheinyl transferase